MKTLQAVVDEVAKGPIGSEQHWSGFDETVDLPKDVVLIIDWARRQSHDGGRALLVRKVQAQP